MTWIKLVISLKHDKVLRLADLTESNPLMVLGAAAEWFRWVDAHVEGDRARISLSGFRAVTTWPDDRLAEGMLHPDVNWLERGRDGMLTPTRPATHFGSGAKGRAMAADRASRSRHGRTVTESAPEKRREEEEKNSARALSSREGPEKPPDLAAVLAAQAIERTRKRNAVAIARQNGVA